MEIEIRGDNIVLSFLKIDSKFTDNLYINRLRENVRI